MVLLGFRWFDWVSDGAYWVLLNFTRITGIYWVLDGTEFHWAALGFRWFYWFLDGHYWVLGGFTGFRVVLLGFGWFFLVFMWFYSVLDGFIGFLGDPYWV